MSIVAQIVLFENQKIEETKQRGFLTETAHVEVGLLLKAGGLYMRH